MRFVKARRQVEGVWGRANVIQLELFEDEKTRVLEHLAPWKVYLASHQRLVRLHAVCDVRAQRIP